MGYTVMPASDQVGVGVTSIGDVAGAYVANEKKLVRFERSVAEGRLPVDRGLLRTPEDELRRAVIHRIICTLKLDYSWIEENFGVNPRTHFEAALSELRSMAADGLVDIDDGGLQVTPTGRFFLRNLCMPFDSYLHERTDGPQYSQTV